jgi:hypothetical protein
MIFEGLRMDALLDMTTLSATPRTVYCRKLRIPAFFYVLLIWGVKLVSS